MTLNFLREGRECIGEVGQGWTEARGVGDGLLVLCGCLGGIAKWSRFCVVI